MTATTVQRPPSGEPPTPQAPRRVSGGILDPQQLLRSTPGALRKLNPVTLWRNPVMFIVEIGSVFTTVLAVAHPTVFAWLITVWLWLTVVFANLAEAVAEGRGKAQADALRRAKTDTMARRLTGWKPGVTDAPEESVAAPALQQGDVVVVEAGQTIPGDGDVIDGIASVDESAITGESAPVIRESGGDRSAVTGGTRVLSDRIIVKITQKPGESFIDRMIALVEGANRQKTPNEIALNILLAALTIIFLLAVATLQPLAIYSKSVQSFAPDSQALDGYGVTGIVLVSLLVCLIPTTIGALLSAIGIAGMDRLVQRNVLAMSGRAVEAAGDVNTLLLDKTGTITIGNRQASEFLTVDGIAPDELADAAQLSSLADETPEGRSVVVFAKTEHGLRERSPGELATATWVPFTAQTRMSGVDLVEQSGVRAIRKGAATAVMKWVRDNGGHPTEAIGPLVDGISASGGTPLVVADMREGSPARALGVIHLKDVVKAGMRERFDEMRRMGIRTVMITGDNPLTARAIAAEAGVDDFLAEAKPEDKMALIKREQEGGKLVAMTGDGTNDAPALAQADVGVAMNTGTSAAKEAGNMVDLDSDPTKLIEIVEIGKQLLITRGALTTFSIANDIAKYFAIIPAMFAAVYPGLDALNIMRLHSPSSAILSAVIFNALIIVALIPLALRGVRYRPSSASAMLRRNLLVYGIGGIVAPFAGIKIIDLLIHFIPGISLMRVSSWLATHLAALRALLVLTVITGLAYPVVIWGVAQLPGLNTRADGSLVTVGGAPVGSGLIGQSFTDPTGKVLVQYFQSRPSAAGDGYDPTATSASNLGPESVVDVLGDPSKANAPDGDGSKPSLLSQVCTRSLAVGTSEGVDGARPYCTAGGVGAVLAVFHRDGATGPVTRAVSVNEACPATPFLTSYEGVAVECAKFGEDYSQGVVTPVRGNAPSVPAVPPDAVTASGSGLDPQISPAYAELQAARVARARGVDVATVRTLIDRYTTGRALGFLGEPGVNVLKLNVALDQQYPYRTG